MVHAYIFIIYKLIDASRQAELNMSILKIKKFFGEDISYNKKI